MQIAVGIWRTIVVDNDVHTFNINAAAKNVSRDEYTLLECFEGSVAIDTAHTI